MQAESRRVTISSPFKIENLLPVACKIDLSHQGQSPRTGAKEPVENRFTIGPGETAMTHKYTDISSLALTAHINCDGYKALTTKLSNSSSINSIKLKTDVAKQHLPVMLRFIQSNDNTGE